MKRRIVAATAVAAVAALALAACSATASDKPSASSGPVTITVSGWSLSTTPEFQTLADGFKKKYPDVTVQLKEYDASNYDTLMTADLGAGTGPDVITQKNIKNVATYEQGGQLLDVSDIDLPKGISGAQAYTIDGTRYAVPYRQDSWVLYYNKALFKKAGVADPDGSWTWDDYAKASEKVTEGLTSAGSSAVGDYQHSWQSTVQGFANAQTPGNILKGKYDYLKPYYERVLKLQSDGAQPSLNTVTANQLTYQGQFGKQQAAMMLMGSWYVATLVAQQASGDADTFDWGFAPAPQLSSKTAGLDKTPVTFGDPTGFAINANIDKKKVTAAKEFLAYAASEAGAKSLAAIGITPALTNDAVAKAYFAVKGAPTDSLSKFAWSTHSTKPENPTSANTAAVQNILNSLHTAVMSKSTPLGQAISDAESQVKNQVG